MDDSQHETDAQRSGEWETSSGGSESRDATLDRAALAWKRHGYHVQYRDEHLVQLARRAWPATAAVLVTLTAIGAVALGWRMFRSWNVVSVVVGLDGKVVMHRQRFDHPPKV